MSACTHTLGHTRSIKISSCSSLIDHCLLLHSLSSTESIHGYLFKVGLHHHTFLGNRLVDLYSRLGAFAHVLRAFQEIPIKNTFTYNILIGAFSRAGHVEGARRIFDEMPERDVVSWNSIISGYVRIGLSGEAFGLLYRMQEHGVRATGFTYSIATSCVTSPWQVKQVHASAIRSGLCSGNTIIGNSLIGMYGRICLNDDACRVFRAMEELDIVSWNSMISMWGDSGYSHQALECFHMMSSSGFSPDEFTMSTLISVFTNLENLDKGEQLLAQCFKMGCLANAIVSSAVIDMYSKCGRLEDSVQLFQEMTRWDSAPCDAMAAAYARSGLVSEALALFILALRSDVRPTEFTLATILNSSSCYVLTEQGTQIHCLVLKLGFEADTIVANALVDIYAKMGSIDSASHIFSEMTSKDLVSMNTMIMGLAQNGRCAEAIRIFKELQERRIQPDRITFLGVLSAFSYEGMTAEGKKLFSVMEEKYGIKHGFEHYACMVDMMCRAGKLREVTEIIQAMPQKPSASIWELVLEACRIHGNLVLAELVAERMMELEPCSSRPYLVLARMYTMRGQWERMARVWRTMKGRGLRKAIGCSWIGIKNHIYAFRSDDMLHYGGEAMYSMLRLLGWEMNAEGYVPERHELFEDGCEE